ncbi:MAG: Asp-tRNA(Asn)/Glu-tRNA(Gln) amidotransferase subunit GatC [Deltaproteobacteria bacterium]|nr:Asp-tRNA(Asn)/Glu-tRNA(Gln) amidotransferase subunit GatC [Deltaproteobacteria bacterium]
MSSLSLEQVRNIADLAMLELSEDELLKIQKELNDIFSYVDKLSAVPTRGVVPTSHVHGVTNAFRNDVVKESLDIEKVAQNAPAFDKQGFEVPKIL